MTNDFTATQERKLKDTEKKEKEEPHLSTRLRYYIEVKWDEKGDKRDEAMEKKRR